jgi:hypothetical protein
VSSKVLKLQAIYFMNSLFKHKSKWPMTARTLINITLCAAISLAASQSLATTNTITPVIHALDSGSTDAKIGKIGGASVGAAATVVGASALGRRLLSSKTTPGAIDTSVDEVPDTPTIQINFQAGRADAAANLDRGVPDSYQVSDAEHPGYFEGYAGQLGRELDAAEAAGDTEEASRVFKLMLNHSVRTDSLDKPAQAQPEDEGVGSDSASIDSAPANEALDALQSDAQNNGAPVANNSTAAQGIENNSQQMADAAKQEVNASEVADEAETNASGLAPDVGTETAELTTNADNALTTVAEDGAEVL